MDHFDWEIALQPFDQRRSLVIPGNAEETVRFCTRQFLQIGNDAIQKNGLFTVALSGGHTPNAMFKELSRPENINQLDWSKVLCFWSDERSVPPSDPDSNYSAAMRSGFSLLPLKPENIFRMKAEEHIEENAKAYERLIREKVPSLQFDLIMLGMGEDGHTASLFPHTKGLHVKDRLVIPNFIPQKNTWRMTLTYNCIQNGRLICIYVIGANKAEMVAKVLSGSSDPENFPIQEVGTSSHKALWILDNAASTLLFPSKK